MSFSHFSVRMRSSSLTTPSLTCPDAANIAAFLWVYCANVVNSQTILCMLFDLIDQTANGDATSKPLFQDLVLCHQSFSHHLARKIAFEFHREYMVGILAQKLLHILRVFMISGLAQFFPVVGDHTGIVASLLECCQRQLCSASLSTAESFIHSTLGLLSALLNHPPMAESTKQEIMITAVPVNIIGILSHAIISAVERSNMAELDMTIRVLSIYQILLHKRVDRISNGDILLSPPVVKSRILECTSRVWHHTLNRILATRPKDTTQTGVRTKALNTWRQYGDQCGLKNSKNVNGSNFYGPSQPSKLQKYWRIPKKCFWNACPCAGQLVASVHRIHVCKGCYRVLYCNATCQAL
ncbi:hypothetical protein BXZ70DRAFT_328221 [Cristinia sonorae]|uniref:MYND-type domain-containing protein n=1 Tax=Cristinia sonorae TaxID=1940300 RepID=A0A8K0UM99_9AGAR|nr:hypothetical protein BXZ70DRAFT_328221 [Cristinia sonorae]